MFYVINIEDGGGQEFFLEAGDRIVSLSKRGSEEPQKFRSAKLFLKKLEQLRPKYPPVCRIYGVELGEFETRRRIVQEEAEQKKVTQQETQHD